MTDLEKTRNAYYNCVKSLEAIEQNVLNLSIPHKAVLLRHYAETLANFSALDEEFKRVSH